MILLCGESCLVLYEALRHLDPAQPAVYWLVNQFFHHPWHGLHFWDLVQPAFMFMAGSAMYISYSRKLEKGVSWSGQFAARAYYAALNYCFLRVALHCVYAGKPVWELWNVLTQLSVTSIMAYLIINRHIPGSWYFL
jgi:predicted acyltransferase